MSLHGHQAWTNEHDDNISRSNRLAPVASGESIRSSINVVRTLSGEKKLHERPRSAPSVPNAASRKSELGTSRNDVSVGKSFETYSKRVDFGSSSRRRRSTIQSRFNFRPSSQRAKSSLTAKFRDQPSGGDTQSYTLTRSNTKISMKIFTNKFFPDGRADFDSKFDSTKSLIASSGEMMSLQRALRNSQEERDKIEAKAQEDMATLAISFSQEKDELKAEFKKERRKLEETLARAERDHLTELKCIKEEQDEAIEAIKEAHRNEMSDKTLESARVQARLSGEISYLKEAFDTFKVNITETLEKKWAKKEREMASAHQEELNRTKTEADLKLEREKGALRASMKIEHEDEIAQLKASHQERITELEENCKEVVVIEQKLEKASTEVATLRVQNEEMKAILSEQKEKIRRLESELKEAKTQLAEYESNFDSKVTQFDMKYQERIHVLMKENSELRQKYISKCEDYFHLEVHRDQLQKMEVKRIEEKMQSLVESQMKSFSEVSLATGQSSGLLSTHSLTENGDQTASGRPASAPFPTPATAHCPVAVTTRRPKTCAAAKRTKVPDVFR
ncbi:flagellum-associated coiled-coil domain-containing protein 1-like [Oscarella lobularis]|uniref:flagellum-associated coiled-coil domain-containing protein 1-like n=1 Tax=Oscarella lobularis TaxID=121494 RepID=UPI003313A9F1